MDVDNNTKKTKNREFKAFAILIFKEGELK